MPVKQIVTTLLFYFFFVSVKGQTSRALLVAIDKYMQPMTFICSSLYLSKEISLRRMSLSY